MTDRATFPASPAVHAGHAPLGAWVAGASRPQSTNDALEAALCALGRPAVFVAQGGRLAVAEGGECQLGAVATGASLPLLAYVPALLPSELGDATFRADHRVEHAYVVGEMANGIASEELVIAAARAGLLGVFGAAGLSVARITSALDRLEGALAGLPWGVNLIHSPDDPRLESAVVDLLLARQVRFVSASAYLDLTVSIVRYRVSGIHRGASGEVVVPNRVMAKVSRVEVARRFFAPPPESMLATLVAEGAITPEQAELARTIPMADDVTAEADSGGHTDNRPLVLLLPALQALRDEVARESGYAARVRVGAAGGMATPASVASAFSMGAAYVVTGSINQCTREAGTSDAVRAMLAVAHSTDVAMAPAADMFEMGVKVQVLTRGSLFAVRAARLYELFRAHDSVDALPVATREELEKKYFRSSLEEAWASCVAFFSERDPEQLTRAEAEPRHKLALLFRAYLGQASRWANDGVAGRQLDYQIWCGPSMGAFNEWTRGSCLEAWESRSVALLARNLLVGAAVLTRVSAVRNQGVRLPADIERFAPRSAAALDALVKPRPVPGTPAEPRALAEARPVHAGRSQDEPIAIVGMGAMFPDAPNLAAFWRLLRTGKDAIKDVPDTHWSVADYYDADPRSPDRTYAKRGAFLEPHPFDPTEFGIPPSILEATDTTQLLGLVVARMAMEDAGYVDGRAWDRSRASVILGVTGAQELAISLGARLGHPRWKRALEDAGVDAGTAADVVERISASYVGWQESSFPGLLGNVVAGRIANRLDFGGTNCILDAACASSLAAVHLAVLELRAGRSDLALTGGVDCLNDIFMHMCFSKTPALSASGEVRPFSASADGTLLGEGLGMVVLKRLSDAERDGDRVYARILSVGTSSDGRAKSVYAPLPSGQARALNAAYEQAGVRPREVTLLEAHGTGTKAGDAAEFEALRSVYTQDEASPRATPAWCTLGTVKSQLGHTKAAAGAAGLIKIALALHHKVLPPTLKVDKPHAGLELETSPFSMSAVARPWIGSAEHARFAAVSSFGFGGSNFHIVATESEKARLAPAWDGSVELLAVSASSASELLAQLESTAKVDAEGEARFLARARDTFDPRHAHRFAAVVTVTERGTTSLAATLAAAIPKIASDAGAAFQLPGGVAYGVGPAPGSVAFLFPGQGSQSVGMLREIACIFPEFLETLESAPDLAAAIYPLATFDEAETARRTAHLTRTDVAQPALGLVERGLLRVLRRFGVTPTHVAGHSYGELTALHAAGVLSADALDRASRARGAAMLGDGGDRGTMLAVLAPLADVEALVADERLDLVIANRNGPRQAVLSGAQAEIGRAESACAARNLRTARLAVGAAFHSPLVAGAASAFGEALTDIEFSAANLPVLAGATAREYPRDVAAAKAQLAQQLAQPVRFDEVIEALHAGGTRTFVEVGPRAALSGMVAAILDGRPFAALALDAGDRRGGLVDLASALAQLAARGHAVDVAAWQREVRLPAPRKTKMNVPLNGANYRAPFEVKPKTAMRTPAAKSPPAISRTDAPAPAHVQPPEPEVWSAQHEGVRALQAMQEQTARVHQIFLEGQIAAHQSLQALLLGTASASPVALAPVRAREDVFPSRLAPVAPVVAAAAASAAAMAPAAVVAPVAPVAPVAAVAAVTEAAPAIDLVALLLEVVAQTTGYPVESLALEMDMEADLGIDSIKRVEILSLLSKRVPGAPSVNPEKLGALRTLEQVATFMRAGTKPAAALPTAMAAPAVATPAPIAPPPEGAKGEDAREALLAVVAQLTGYPRETLDLTMDMEADLGIDSIKRVEILSLLSKRIPNAPAVNPEKLAGLRTLEQVLAFATNGATNGAARAATTNATTTATTGERHTPAPPAESAPLAAAPVRRGVVVAVAAPEVTGSSELPRGPIFVTRDHAGLALALVRRLAEAGADARVIDAAEVPAGPVGALVLLAPGRPTWDAASEGDLMDALRAARSVGPRLRESGSSSNALLVAVSRRDGAFGHTTQAAVWNPLQAGLAGLAKSAAHEWPEVSCRAIDVASSLSLDDAAKAIVRELETHGPREVGVGPAGRVALALRAPHLQAREASVLGDGAIVVTGGARGVTFACARALALRTGAKLVLLGRSPEPAPEPAWLASASTEAEIKRACLENAPAGERPAPKALGEACRAVLANREVEGSLRALAAEGIVAVYRSVDVRDGARVAAILTELRPAVGPFRALVHGAGVIRDKRLEDKQDKDLEDVLAPKILGLRSLLEATRGDDLRSIVLFASATGRFGRRGQADYAVANQALVSIAQVEAARRPRCRVVALDWGPWEGGMVTPALRAEFEREGVPLLPLAQGAQAMCDDALAVPGGPTEIVLGAGFGSDEVAAWTLASSYRLDASSFPVLRDHVLAGKAVLPLALSIEWLIAGASHVECTDVTSLEDIRVFRGVTLGAEPEDVFVWVGPREPSADGHGVVVELRGASGHVHVRAHASFGALSLPAPSLAPPPSLRPFRTPMPHVYAEQLFHGQSLHAIESIEGMSEAGMVLRLRSHPTSERLLPLPVVAWRLDPLVLDGVFQALIVWCRENVGAPSLPSRLGALRFLAAPLASSLRATVRIRSREGMVVRADIDLHDEHGALCVRVEGFECTASASLQRAFAAAASPEKPSTVPVA